jgi:hypothetical protein
MSRLDSAQFAVSILGRALVTPLGSDIPRIWAAVREGQSPPAELLDYAGWRFPVYPAQADLEPALARHQRMRRASPISHFATAAARACLADAGWNGEEATASVDGLIFAASDGSVVYTRKFFEGVDQEGPGQGSPLLFPETVYNAPASHICAVLGLTGPSLSLVGDAAVTLSALRTAVQYLVNRQCRRVLVVAAEELDPVALAGYAAWKITNPVAVESADSTTVPSGAAAGAVFAEGAGALLLGWPGEEGCQPLGSLRVGDSHTFGDIREGAVRLEKGVRELLAAPPQQEAAPALLFSGLTGSWSSAFEKKALIRSSAFPELNASNHFTVKKTLGEGLAAGTLWQIITALEALRNRSDEASPGEASALVTVLGYNGETGAALVK